MDINSEALQYGYGIFETILIKDGQTIYFDEHYNRAISGLNYLNMTGVGKALLLSDLSTYIKEHRITFGVVKICFYLDHTQTKVVFYHRPFPYKESEYHKGFKMCLSAIKRHSENPIYKIKSTNFINNRLEKNNVVNRGYDESVHLNEKNYITECIYANIFFIKNNIIYTPDADLGLLSGIMRQKVIDISKKIGITVKIGYYGIEDLKNADEIFLTSSIIGIMRVTSFEEMKYKRPSTSLLEVLLKEI